MGSHAVVEVDVSPIADLGDRQQWLHRLKRLADDPLVTAVVLHLQGPLGGWAALQDLRQVVQEIRAADTPVYAVLQTPGNALTWLASACDHVIMVPTGEVGLVGVGVELTFFGEALRRMGVSPDFEAAGAYKSFGEPWTRTFPSPENQEAMTALVQDLHQQLVSGIAEGRGKDREEVAALLERAPLSADQALEAGLVDRLAYPDELEDWLKERHGDAAHLVGFGGWALRDSWRETLGRWGRVAPRIQVLHLQGPIVVEGQGQGPHIAARSVAPMLASMREDDQISAVVLHVDSPGGSAFASDLIWREVDELRKTKPVVASFEDTAASGGYYLSAPASEILVRPGTLTGSIGVFGGKLVVAEGMRKVGVHSSEVLGAPNANLFSASRRFTPPQRARFRSSLQRMYDGFVSRVADGRGKETDEIEPHCRGRVWTGNAAVERDLANATGNLDDAVERARELAGLSGRAFTRRDASGFRAPWGARLVQGAMRRAAPGASAATDALARLGVALPSPLLRVVLTHPEQPLAMLPFDLRPR
ncbi:MAG: S49 family peptidase [Myxococcales bacterium]|nr:S49 family peptidase [Myxococcales bacterium]